ncbi:hypothetical protein Tco_1307527, partial [Tanacetum coccineum]
MPPALSRMASPLDCNMAGQASVGSKSLVLLLAEIVLSCLDFELACFSVASFSSFLVSSGSFRAVSTVGLVLMPTDTSWLRSSNLMDASPFSAFAFGFKDLG